MKHPTLQLIVALITLGLVAYTLCKMPLNRTGLAVWFNGAFGAFVDGFVDGFPVGTPAGAAIGAADGQLSTELGTRHIVIELVHLFAIPIGTGLADVRAWRKTHSFPDVFKISSPPVA